MKLIALLLMSLGAGALVFAADMPTGESLIKKFIEKEGGEKGMERAQSVVMTGTVELVGHNLSGPLEIYQKGDKSYTVIDLPGIGKIEEGFDGAVAWEANVLQGSRVKDGAELEAARRASHMTVLGAWKEYYKSAETLGAEDVEGKPAWKVEMTPKEGSVEEYYFDKTSGLLTKISQTLPTALGDIPVEMIISDYRMVDGIQTPFLMKQSAMSQNMAMHMDKVSYDTKIPESRFDLPEAIQAIVAKTK